MSNLVKKRSRESCSLHKQAGKHAKIKSEHKRGENVEVYDNMFEESALSLGANGDGFHMGRWLNPLRKVKVYLPKLKLPNTLPRQDEKALFDLSEHLRVHGFEVSDRRTLAFFAIGKKLNVQAAVKCFLEFYKLTSTLHFRFPDIRIIEQVVAESPIEGFICQSDGTAGLCVRPSRCTFDHTPAIYLVREMLCHVLHLANLSLLKNGSTQIGNMRDIRWRNFAPFDIANIARLIANCNPIFDRTIIFIDSSWYMSVAYNVLLKMMPTTFTDVLQILQLSEVSQKFPDMLLPPSLSPSTTNNVSFCHLSAEEQIAIQVLVEQ